MSNATTGRFGTNGWTKGVAAGVTCGFKRLPAKTVKNQGALWTYNNHRPNMGIGGVPPAMKLKMAAYILQMHPVKKGEITPPPDDKPRHRWGPF